MLYSKETLQKWNIPLNKYNQTVQKIRLPGYRLTFQEKEELLYHIKEYDETIPQLIETLKFKREYEKTLIHEKKLVTKFVTEWRRLTLKYNGLNPNLQEKSIEELVDLWYNDYFELYFQDHIELIEFYGAKEYAQIYLWNGGAIPVEEVTIWKK